jgi:hypothetical protein
MKQKIIGIEEMLSGRYVFPSGGANKKRKKEKKEK